MKTPLFIAIGIITIMSIYNPANSQDMKKNYSTKSHREVWLKYRESWESDLNIQTMRMLTGRNIQGVRYSLTTGDWEYSYKENSYEKTETLNFNKIQIYPQGGHFLNKKDKKNERYRFVNFMVDSLSKEINKRVICYLSRRVDDTTDSYTLFFTEKGKLKHITIELFFMELRLTEVGFDNQIIWEYYNGLEPKFHPTRYYNLLVKPIAR